MSAATPDTNDERDAAFDLRRVLAADFARVLRHTTGGKPISRLRRSMHLSLPAMQVAILHRCAHALYRGGFPRVAGLVSDLSLRLTGASLHPGSRIGPGLFVPHPARIVFCGSAGCDLTLLPAALVGPSVWTLPWQPFPECAPRLGDGVVIGAHAAVQGDCEVADRAMVGVGVSTLIDVPAGTMTVLAKRMIITRGGSDAV